MAITVIITCLMGPGTLEAKLIPLSRSPLIARVIVLRKSIGPKIDKVEYIKLPSLCNFSILNCIITPILLTYYTKKHKVDLIISYHFIPHAFFAAIASFFTRVPYNVSQTGLYIERYAKKKIYRWLIMSIMRKSLFINVPGNTSKIYWVNNGLDRNKINILHSKIDSQIFSPINSNKSFDYIYLGRLSKEKRIDLIIRGIQELKKREIKTNLVIVGDGSEMLRLKNLSKELDLTNEITFVGFVNDPSNWLNNAKIFLLCSESDALPTALMQAMSCKLVVIAPNVGNISDLVEHNINGYLFESNDISTFYKLMAETYNNYACLGNIAENARMKILEEYTYENATNLWNKIIKERFFIS